MGEVEVVMMVRLGGKEGMNDVKVLWEVGGKVVNKKLGEWLFGGEDGESMVRVVERELRL